MLGYVVVIYPGVTDQVRHALDSSFPGLFGPRGININEIASAKAGAGILGLVGLLYSGLGWIDALRDALRSVWHQNVLAGNFIAKKVTDIGLMIGLGVTLLVSIAISGLATAVTTQLLSLVGLADYTLARGFLTVFAIAVAVVTDLAFFLFVFTRLPKVKTPWRQVIKGAVFAAVGFEILKLVGTYLISRTTHNTLYGPFAIIVGLLVWINLVARYTLLAAAWTVTAPYDTDVHPSGTASRAAAREAGVPEEYADADPDEPPVLYRNGAPTPLRNAVAGKTPPQEEPVGPPEPQPPAVPAPPTRPGVRPAGSRPANRRPKRCAVSALARSPSA